MKKYISLVLSIISVLICCAGILPACAAPDFDVDIKFEKYVTLPELHLPIQSLEAGNVRSVVYFRGENIPESASLIMGLYEGDKLVEVKAKSVTPQTALIAATNRLEVPAENISNYKIKSMVMTTGNVSPLTKVKILTSSEKKILSFKVGNIEAEIFDGIGEIVLPEFSTETAPQIEVSPGATVWPASGVDLTDPDGTVYTVTAADGTEAYYTLKMPQQHAWFRRDTDATYITGQTVPQSNNWQSTTLGSDQSISYMVDSTSGNRYRNITDASTSASTTYEWYCPAGEGRPDSWKFDLKFRFNKPESDYSANSVFFYLRNSTGKVVEFYATANDTKIPDIHGFSMYTSQAYPSVPSSVMLETSDKKYKHLEYDNWYNIRISFEKVTDTKGLMSWYVTNESGDYIHSGRFDSVIDASIAAQKIGYFGLTTRALGKSSIDIEYVRLYDHAKHMPVVEPIEELYPEPLVTLDSLPDKNALQLLANLYDPKTGLFYHAISARDNEPFAPCLEATWFALQIMEDGGLLPRLPDNRPDFSIFTEEMQRKLVQSVQNMQDENDGYFYDSQWGKNVTLTRKGRDLMWAKFLLKTFDAQPLYLYPEQRKNTASALMSTSLWFESEESFKEYLDSFGWRTGGECYAAGSELGSQMSMIKAAGLFETATEYIREKQNTNTGLWGEGLSYDNTNAAMKLASFFDAEHPYPNVDKMVESVIRVIETGKTPEAITEVWNPLQTINLAIDTYDGDFPHDLRQKILECIDDLTRITLKNLKLFKKPDGGYSEYVSGSTKWISGAPSSLGLYESDMDGTTIALLKCRESIYHIMGHTREKTHFIEYKDWFAQKLQTKPDIVK